MSIGGDEQCAALTNSREHPEIGDPYLLNFRFLLLDQFDQPEQHKIDFMGDQIRLNL